MTDSIVKHNYRGFTVHQLKGSGYLNLAHIAKATKGNLQKWKNLDSTKALLMEFNKLYNECSILNDRIEPLEVKYNPFTGGRGTWAHPDIAIQFAHWCNPTIGLKVTEWAYHRKPSSLYEEYILSKVDKKGSEGVTLTSFYMGFRNSKKFSNKPKSLIRQALIDLSNRRLIDYDSDREIAYKR
ncbi:KilA-N domain-containing protein [Leptolyngbya sp. PCC 7375]|nr:KilA-N domain-containing protein [Leptolyngbya sp. PCC 7375]